MKGTLPRWISAGGLFFGILSVLNCPGQSKSSYDSSYVVSYRDMITGRAYLSQKYTLFVGEAPEGTQSLQYRPNTTVNLGVGATFRSFTLNLAYGFPFLNENTGKGRTRYLDLQTHIYATRLNIDLFGQFYKGYYLYPRGYAMTNKEIFYLRPDLRVQELGAHVYYLFNYRKFSYQASFTQNAWQKKSAGTFLFGGGVTYGSVQADSAFVPSSLRSSFLQEGVRGLRYFEAGPGAAYAYTFVFKEHWFVTAAATASLDLGFVTERSDSSRVNNRRFSPNTLFRAVGGYNSEKWMISVSWITNRTAISGRYRDGGYHVTTGNYRFTLSRRFHAGEHLHRMIR